TSTTLPSRSEVLIFSPSIDEKTTSGALAAGASRNQAPTATTAASRPPTIARAAPIWRRGKLRDGTFMVQLACAHARKTGTAQGAAGMGITCVPLLDCTALPLLVCKLVGCCTGVVVP